MAGRHRGDLVDIARRRDLDDIHADQTTLADLGLSVSWSGDDGPGVGSGC
jgi:hypothetical protein